jgi:hypothetical protein
LFARAYETIKAWRTGIRGPDRPSNRRASETVQRGETVVAGALGRVHAANP